MNKVPLINGKAYAWANISFMVAGVNVVAITAINYGEREDKVNGRGAGKYVIDRAEGNVEPFCDITLKAHALEELAAKAPGRSLTEFGVFDILVQYLVGTARVTHKIRNCEFTENKRELTQGATEIGSQIQLIISHVEW